MCDVVDVGIAVAVVAAAGEGYNAYQQNQQAKAQKNYNSQLAAEGNAAAQKAYQANQQALQAKQQQQTIQTGQQIAQEQQKAIQAKGRARVAAAGAGVGGVSVGQMLTDFDRQQSQFDSTANMNLAFAKQQDALDLMGAQASEQGQIASYLRPNVIMPGYVGAALGFGSDVGQIGSSQAVQSELGNSYGGG